MYELTDDNFEAFAMYHYQNPMGKEVEDFFEDLNRIKYIKRLINRYQVSEKLTPRLLMNHVIIFCNSFGIPASLRILEFKLSKDLWPVLKPFLIELKYINEYEYKDIVSDHKVIEEIRKM